MLSEITTSYKKVNGMMQHSHHEESCHLTKWCGILEPIVGAKTLCHVNSGRWHDRSTQDALPKCAVKSVTVRKNSRQFALTVVIVLAVLALSLIPWPALLRLVLYAIHQTRTHTSVCHWCLGRLTHLLPTYLHYDTISAIMPILLWIAFTCPCLASY